MNFIQASLSGFRRYFDFKGRSTRSEFWWFWLFVALTSLFISTLEVYLLDPVPEEVGFIPGLWMLIATVPFFAVSARRLHDIGKSGWWSLLWLIYLIGWIPLIYWYCQPSSLEAKKPQSASADRNILTLGESYEITSSSEVNKGQASIFAKIGVGAIALLGAFFARFGDDVAKYGDDSLRYFDDAARVSSTLGQKVPTVSKSMLSDDVVRALEQSGATIPRTTNYDELIKVFKKASDLPIMDIADFIGNYAQNEIKKDKAIKASVKELLTLSDVPIKRDFDNVTSMKKIKSSDYFVEDFREDSRTVVFSVTSNQYNFPELNTLVPNEANYAWAKVFSSDSRKNLPSDSMSNVTFMYIDAIDANVSVQGSTYLTGNQVCFRAEQGHLLLDKNNLPSFETLYAIRQVFDLIFSDEIVTCTGYEQIEGDMWRTRTFTPTGYEYINQVDTSEIYFTHSDVNWDAVRNFLKTPG